MKKLLATTALVGLVASSASFAETKISGSIEATYNSISEGSTSAAGSGGLGNEVNLKISNTTELDNGLTASGHINFEDKGSTTAYDSQAIALSTGDFKFYVGTDTGQHMNSNINPKVDDAGFDSMSGEIGNDGMNRYATHDVNHVGVNAKSDFGTVAVMYSPSGAGASQSAGGTTSADGSSLEYNFKGSFGVDGLTVLAGKQKIEAKDSASTTADELEEEETYVGFSYKYGQFAVGAGKRTHDDGDSASANNSVDNSTSYSATYSVNDQISLGYEITNAEKELSNASNPEEETKAMTIGYDLGGMGVSFMWTETDNVGASNAAADDKEAFQIRTVYKF
jgi:hypothetical protein